MDLRFPLTSLNANDVEVGKLLSCGYQRRVDDHLCRVLGSYALEGYEFRIEDSAPPASSSTTYGKPGEASDVDGRQGRSVAPAERGGEQGPGAPREATRELGHACAHVRSGGVSAQL